MNYLYIFDEFTVASEYGIGTYIKQLIVALKNRPNIKIALVILNSNKEEYEIVAMDYVVIYVPSISKLNIENDNYKYYRNVSYLLCRYIGSLLSRWDRLIFHYNYPNYNLFSQMKRRLPQSVAVYTVHFFPRYSPNVSYNDEFFVEKIEKNCDGGKKYVFKMYECVDKIICLSSHMKYWIMENYQIPEMKIALILNGLRDEGVILSDKERKNIRDRLFFSSKDKIILLGRGYRQSSRRSRPGRRGR